jgi:hypothetical protein
MSSVILRAIALASVVFVAGCEWDEPVGPDGQVFRSVNAGNTVAAPSNLTASATSHFEIGVSWQDNSNNEAGFEFHQSSTGANGTFFLLYTVGPGTTSAFSSGLGASTEYCYRVRAFMIKGRKTTYSAFSNTSCATTRPLPLPDAPTNVSVKPVSSHAVRLSWTAPTQYGIRIERSGSANGPWTILMTGVTDIRSYDDSGLPVEATLCYRVTAFNGYGFSPPSAVDCTALPASPSSLTAIALDASSVELRWDHESAYEEGFEIHRWARDGVVSVVATLPANTTSHVDRGVTTGVRHSYAVYATRDDGKSGSSNVVSVTTVAEGQLYAPDLVEASPFSSSGVNVRWTAAPGMVGSYRVERSTDQQLTWVTFATSDPSSRDLADPDRQTEQPVCYRVFTVEGERESAPSDVDCTTPPAAPSNLSIWTDTYWDVYFVGWTDNSNAEDGYELWMSYYDCAYSDMGECIPVISYFAYSLPAGQTSQMVGYWEEVYGVVAIKDGGYSDWLLWSPQGAASLSTRASQQVQRRAAAQRQLPPGAKLIREKPDKVRSRGTGPRR